MGLFQDEQGPYTSSASREDRRTSQELEGRRPEDPDGRQPKNWRSCPLRGTFLTQAGSSHCWRSTTDVLDFAYRMLEIAHEFYFFKLSLPRLRAGGRGVSGKLYDEHAAGIFDGLQGLGFRNISVRNIPTPFESMNVQILIRESCDVQHLSHVRNELSMCRWSLTVN